MHRGGVSERDRAPSARAVILIGFMGAGKTSVGRSLASQLGWAFEDLDERVERREGRRVADIFREFGETGFRKAEHAALKELLDLMGNQPERVIALGGGAFAQQSNALLIAAAKIPTAFLDADVEELWERCERQSGQLGVERPLMGDPNHFRSLYEERKPYYLKASLRQETGGKTPEQIAAELIAALRLSRKRSRSEGEKR